jgi:hypothetical protein
MRSREGFPALASPSPWEGDCTAEGCVVANGQPFCCHPCKGGVPAKFKGDLEIQKIYAEACTVLGVPNKNLLTQ